jgi:hypothetical protein
MLDTEKINQAAMHDVLTRGLDGALAKWQSYYSRVKGLQTGVNVNKDSEKYWNEGPGNPTGDIPAYGTGGPIYSRHLAYVDPGEWMLKASDVAALGGFSGVEKLVAAIRTPNLSAQMGQAISNVRYGNTYNTNRSKTDKSVNLLGNVVLPQVRDSGAFVRELQRLGA